MMSKKRQSRPQTAAPEASGFNFNSVWVPLAAGFILFATGLSHAMTGIDDHQATVENPAVQSFANLFTQFNLGMYAPLTWLGYSLAFHLGGKSPLLYHLMGFAVHLVNIWLVWKLLKQLRVGDGAVTAIALLFAIHPIQVESVSWIAGFSTPLFSLFYLLSCLQYLQYADTQKMRPLALSLAFFTAACLAKSAAVTLPLTLMALDWWRKPEMSRNKRLLGYLPFFALALGFGLLTVYSRQQSGVAITPEGSSLTLAERAVVVLYTPVFYWAKLILPLKLNIYYAFEKTGGALPWYYYAGAAAFLATLYAAWRYRAQASWASFGLAFYMANILVMLPFASLGTFELCADHYNYLAVVGAFFVLVHAWQSAVEKRPNIAWASYLWVIAVAVLCFRQVRTWKDTYSVLTHAIDNGSHQNGLLYFSRGVELGDQKRTQEAIADFQKAIEINPNLKDAYKYRGSLLGQTGQIDRALTDLEHYIKLDPEDAVIWNNLAMIYKRQGKLTESIGAFTKTIEIKPDAAISYQNRAKIYEMMGDSARMRADLLKAREISEGKKK